MQDQISSEIEQLERLKAGDLDAFEQLVEEHQDKLINTCFRFVHSRQDAEDVAQEVFLAVHQSIDSFRGQSKLSSWIFRIAVTKSLDFVRRANRKKRSGRLKRVLGWVNDGEQAAIEPEESRSALDELADKERAEILRGAVDALPENQRIAVNLHNYQGFRYTEVAQIMETSVSSVESLLHRARKNLEKRLAHYFSKNFDN